MMINSIQDIQNLVKNGFTNWRELGGVSVKQKDDLLIFNYTNAAQFSNRWNNFECLSRGLIINKNGEIIARPFDKFFNWMENNRYTDAPILTITEKLDGSLGILYRQNGKFKIATRGSFDSKQAIFATEYFNNRTLFKESIHNRFTFLFEIIYPDNRIVVDYGNRYDLVLLDVRDRFTGQYLRPYNEVLELADFYRFSTPDVYSKLNIDDILEILPKLDNNHEGFVVEFEDSQRFKFKGDKYRELHRIINSISFKNTLEHVKNGTIDEMLSVIPDEFLSDITGWIGEIYTTINNITEKIDSYFDNAPKSTRKEFAIWCKDNVESEFLSMMFHRLDGKPLDDLIYKYILSIRKD